MMKTVTTMQSHAFSVVRSERSKIVGEEIDASMAER